MIDWARQNVASFDLIHLHGVRSFQNNLFRHYAQQNNIPYLLTPHGGLDQTRLNTWRVLAPEKQIHLKTLASASLILPASKIEHQELLEADIPEDRLHLLPPGIEISLASQDDVYTFRQAYQWTDEDLVAVYLGRSDPKTGIHHLMRAYQRIQTRLPELKLLIQIQELGDIDDWKRRAELLEIDHGVRFCGPLRIEARLQALSAADVVVATDRNPGVELAPLEALLCGTPVVVSKASGVGEWLGPCNGAYFFPASDVEVLAVGLVQALTESQGVKERLERGRECVQTNFNWHDIVDQLELIYIQALQLQPNPEVIEITQPAQS
jgi:glycosyltransferase involved in cell wall biosynthesis